MKIILHIINGLGNGGAERVLYTLCKADTLNKHYVISLTNKGVYAELLISSGIVVKTMNMKNPLGFLSSMIRIFHVIKKINPDIVQTWMPYSDLIGGVIARASGVKEIYWGVHLANIDLLPVKTKFVVRICSKLSYFLPMKIICCAESSRVALDSAGYDRSKMEVINNGYDELYYQNTGKNLKKSDLFPSMTEESVILGSVTRWDIYKDIPNLLKSLKDLVNCDIDFKCILVGCEIDKDNVSLLELLNELNLEEHVILLGARSDIPVILRTIDIFVLSSASEAFPNVIVESMLCGTPCVATDVGDVAKIIDRYGWIVPPLNSSELSRKIMLAVSDMKDTKQWLARKSNCRSWAKNNFSIDRMVNSYNQTWNS